MIILAASCDNRSDLVAPPSVGLTSAYLAGDAARSLGADGKFVLPDSLIHPRSELREEGAKRLATMYAHTFGRFLVSSWQGAHRGEINYASLQPCGRAIYARNAYSRLPDDVSVIAQRTFGPHWIVAMCDRGDQPAVVITFSSLATELEDSSDSVRIAGYSQTDFRSHGIPIGSTGRLLFSPEGAAEEAHRLSGRRVTSVPDLVLTPMPDAPALVRWKVALEEPIQVKATTNTEPHPVRDLYVGFDGTFGSSGLLEAAPDAQVGATPRDWPDVGKGGKRFSPMMKTGVPAKTELLTVVNP